MDVVLARLDVSGNVLFLELVGIWFSISVFALAQLDK